MNLFPLLEYKQLEGKDWVPFVSVFPTADTVLNKHLLREWMNIQAQRPLPLIYNVCYNQTCPFMVS